MKMENIPDTMLVKKDKEIETLANAGFSLKQIAACFCMSIDELRELKKKIISRKIELMQQRLAK